MPSGLEAGELLYQPRLADLLPSPCSPSSFRHVVRMKLVEAQTREVSRASLVSLHIVYLSVLSPYMDRSSLARKIWGPLPSPYLGQDGAEILG